MNKKSLCFAIGIIISVFIGTMGTMWYVAYVRETARVICSVEFAGCAAVVEFDVPASMIEKAWVQVTPATSSNHLEFEVLIEYRPSAHKLFSREVKKFRRGLICDDECIEVNLDSISFIQFHYNAQPIRTVNIQHVLR